MKNPNKYIRQAIISALPGIQVFYKRIPKNIATPVQYIILNSQTKQQFARAKDCYEWICQVNIDCWVHGVQGMPPSTAVDDLEESVLSVMDGVQVTGSFTTKYVKLLNQVDLSLETSTESVERRILTYEIWLNKL